MTSTRYDIVIIGGGIAGAALAKSLAEQGVRVLVLERETAFKDRVRGEAIMPWGTAEAKTLGIYDDMIDSGGHDLPLWNSYVGDSRRSQRDLVGTSVPKVGVTARAIASEWRRGCSGRIRVNIGVGRMSPGGKTSAFN